MDILLETTFDDERDARERLEAAFRRSLGPVGVTVPRGRRVGAVFTGTRIGYARVLTVASSGLGFGRSARMTDRHPLGAVTVVLQRQGVASIAQDGRDTVLRGGQAALVDMRRPFAVRQFDDFTMNLVRLPHDIVARLGGALEDATGRVIAPGSGVGGVFVDFVARLADVCVQVSAGIGERLAGHTAELLATVLEEGCRADGARTDAALPRVHLVDQVLGYIDTHLGDPGLSPEAIAAQQRITVGHLHRLFDGEGAALGRIIERRRVDACVRELDRRAAVRPRLTEVARRWGFADTAHFTEAFAAVHGTPFGTRRARPLATG
ncbi:helix-turn-helix domain-containing protein [Embleya sp. NPDC020630]|uniref:AraC-like ligand-binding domain-containing protein n=1 Tax=Embleya sp. NPDC020630 TaxID=3363979 RepID=UPI0037B2BE4E